MKQAGAGLAALLLGVSTAAPSRAEFHLQYGKLLNPFSGAEEQTLVFTLQQASEWKFGDSFFFIDHLDDSRDDGFNDREFYAEWYPTLSLGKLAGRDFRLGPIADFSLVAGFNASGDGKVVKYLPGLRASWNLPGFLFLNTDLTAYLDGNTGISGGGPPATGNSFLFDVNWVFSLRGGKPVVCHRRSCRVHRRYHRRAGRRCQLLDSRPAAVHLGPGQRDMGITPPDPGGYRVSVLAQQAGNRPRREHGATAAGLAPLKARAGGDSQPRGGIKMKPG